MTNRIPNLLPPIGILGESGALDPDNAKALPAGCLHHNPALQAIHHSGTQLLQAGDLGRNIVSFTAPHAGRRCVLRMDVQDFFPSLRRPRVLVYELPRRAARPPREIGRAHV